MSKSDSELIVPEGWECTSVAELCEKIQDGTHFSPKTQLSAGTFPYVTAKNVRNSGLDLSNLTYLREHDHRKIYERCDCRKGDVLLVKDGVNTGDVAVNTLDGEISLLSSVCLLRPHASLLSSEYLRYYLQSPQGNRSLTGRMTGTAIRRIILGRIKQTPIVFCALGTQRRIVEEIDSYLTRLDDAVASLERVQARLKAYRASVLKEAVEGRLVPTEASLAHAGRRDYEPAEVLLARILKERRRRWEESELAKFKAAGKTPKGDKWKNRYEEPVVRETNALPVLPAGWCWASTDQLCAEITDGDHQPPPVSESGVPFLVIGNVRTGTPDFSECRRVPQSYYESLDWKRKPDSNDLLYTVVGSLGIPARISDDRPFCVQRHIAILKAPRPEVRDYLIHALASGFVFRQASRMATGTAQKTLGLGSLRKIVIPLPPLAEMVRINAEIDHCASIGESVATSIMNDRLRASRLRQAVLKWAFEGKLTDQDRTDEPADKLLACIRAERAAVPPTKKTRGHRKTKGAA